MKIKIKNTLPAQTISTCTADLEVQQQYVNLPDPGNFRSAQKGQLIAPITLANGRRLIYDVVDGCINVRLFDYDLRALPGFKETETAEDIVRDLAYLAGTNLGVFNFETFVRRAKAFTNE